MNITPKGHRRLRKICRNGHPLSESRTNPKGYLLCRMCERDRRNKYYKNHPERAIINALNDRRIRERNRKNLLISLGNKCVKCGFVDARALQIDHVNGGGSQEARKHTVNARQKMIEANPENYQLLCANCNAIKAYENGERHAKY